MEVVKQLLLVKVIIPYARLIEPVLAKQITLKAKSFILMEPVYRVSRRQTKEKNIIVHSTSN